MTARPGLLPVDMLCFAVYSTAHAFTRAYRPLLAPHGLTYPQYLVLLLLWSEDGRSVSELGKPLFLDSGTLTPLLRRLESAGFIRRERHDRDERQIRIRLTEAGRALEEHLADVPASIGCAVGLTPQELRDATARMQDLAQSLRATAGRDADA